MLAPHPDQDEDLLDQAHEAERAGVPGQPPQLDDQLVEVVGQILGERLDVRLAVLAIGREHEVDLVLGRVLEIVVVVVSSSSASAGAVFGFAGLPRASSSSNDSYSSSSKSDMIPPSPCSHPICPGPSCQTAAIPEPAPLPATGSRDTFERGTAHRRPSARRSQAHGAARHETDSPTFRRLTEELVTLLAYEATRDVRVTACIVQTPLMEAAGVKLPPPRPLVVPILRAGLGMLEGMTRLMPTAEVGFLGMVRNEETLAATTYAERLPDDLLGPPVLRAGPDARDRRHARLGRAVPGQAWRRPHHLHLPARRARGHRAGQRAARRPARALHAGRRRSRRAAQRASATSSPASATPATGCTAWSDG